MGIRDSGNVTKITQQKFLSFFYKSTTKHRCLVAIAMNGYQFAHSPAPLRRVKYVQFGILSPEEIVRGFAYSASIAPPGCESRFLREDLDSRLPTHVCLLA
jgi:hypothetical protein